MGADFLEAVGERDVGLLVEARHQFEHHGHFLALLCGAGEVFHQHRVGAGAIHSHLDRQHLRVVRGRAQHLDHRAEALEGVMEQDVAAADGSEDLAALVERLGQAGDEGRVLEVGAFHPVRHLHQANQIDDARGAVEVVGRQVEVLEQESRHLIGAVVRHLQAHGVAEVALLEFALERGAQVLDLFLVDEQVGVAGDPELVAAEHVHAGE